MTERRIITINTSQLRFPDDKDDQVYRDAAKTLLESGYKHWVTTSKEQYDWLGLVESIKEGWDPCKVGINYRILDVNNEWLTLQSYEVVEWKDGQGQSFYKPLTVHRTIVLFTLPEMDIDVVLVS